jgi:hypothetical protein
MRNIFLTTLAVLAITFSSCKKDTPTPTAPTTTPPATTPPVTTPTMPVSTDFKDKIVGNYNVVSTLIGSVLYKDKNGNNASRDTTITQNNKLVITKDDVYGGLVLTETEPGKIPFAFRVSVTEMSDKTGFTLSFTLSANIGQDYTRNNIYYTVEGIQILSGSSVNGSGIYSDKTISYNYSSNRGYNYTAYYPDYFKCTSTAVKQ